MTCSCRKMRLVLLSSAVALGVAASSHGQVAKVGNDLLSSLSFTSPVLAPSERIEPLAAAKSALPRAVREGWTAFGQDAKSEWRAVVDRRTGRISLAEGGNVAAIPGAGNRLQQSDIASFLAGKPKPDLAVLDAITRSFLQRFAPLLGADPRTLRLNLGRSGQPASHVWFVDYDVVREGLPVEGARVVFRYNNGNLVQWGSELLPSSGAGVPLTRTTLEQALAVLEGYVGPGAGDTLLDGGSLHLLPANVAAVGAPGGFRFGGGRDIAKVWQITFRRDGVMGTWRARVDAASGELLELVDVNDYAQVSGGVFLNSPTTGAETVRPMPYAEVGAGAFASSGGVFPSF